MRNKIYNEDCLDAIVHLETRSVKLICADPPYFQGRARIFRGPRRVQTVL